MRADGIIRRLGAVFDSRRLGYCSTLVAARVPASRLAEVARMVSRLPGVTHNYARNRAYNLWFTLTAQSPEEIERILSELRRETGIADFHSLPALAVYKIRVVFGKDAEKGLPAVASAKAGTIRFPGDREPVPERMDDDRKRLVRLLQEDIPVEAEPFAVIAGPLGWPVQRVIDQVAEWSASGVIRRFGAVVGHRRMGFTANGMAVFRVPDGLVDDAGRRLAACPEVSHCYRRPPMSGFNYNLFAMVHGRSEEEVRTVVDRVAREMNIADVDVLYSTDEYKKTSMKYFPETPSS
jgi:DNA-binding Lrp family transcriptional regulator